MVKMGMPEVEVNGVAVKSPEDVVVAVEEDRELVEPVDHLDAEHNEDSEDSEEIIDDDDTQEWKGIEVQNDVDDEDKGDVNDNDDIFSQLILAEREIAEAESDVDIKKEELKEAKAHLELCNKRLRRLAQSVKNDSQRPLLAESVKVNSEHSQEGGSSDRVNGQAGQLSDDDGAWRECDLYELDLPLGIEDKLHENGIDTVGELEDLRAKISIGKASWPKGIGPAKVTIIEDAVLAWL